MAPPRKKRTQLSRTAKYYRDNPGARKRKAKKDVEQNSRKSQVKKRVESLRARRKAKKKTGKNPKGDYDHATKRFVSSKTNRGRVGEGNRKRGKRKTKKK